MNINISKPSAGVCFVHVCRDANLNKLKSGSRVRKKLEFLHAFGIRSSQILLVLGKSKLALSGI